MDPAPQHHEHEFQRVPQGYVLPLSLMPFSSSPIPTQYLQPILSDVCSYLLPGSDTWNSQHSTKETKEMAPSDIRLVWSCEPSHLNLVPLGNPTRSCCPYKDTSMLTGIRLITGRGRAHGWSALSLLRGTTGPRSQTLGVPPWAVPLGSSVPSLEGSKVPYLPE